MRIFAPGLSDSAFGSLVSESESSVRFEPQITASGYREPWASEEKAYKRPLTGSVYRAKKPCNTDKKNWKVQCRVLTLLRARGFESTYPFESRGFVHEVLRENTMKAERCVILRRTLLGTTDRRVRITEEEKEKEDEKADRKGRTDISSKLARFCNPHVTYLRRT